MIDVSFDESSRPDVHTVSDRAQFLSNSSRNPFASVSEISHHHWSAREHITWLHVFVVVKFLVGLLGQHSAMDVRLHQIKSGT